MVTRSVSLDAIASTPVKPSSLHNTTSDNYNTTARSTSRMQHTEETQCSNKFLSPVRKLWSIQSLIIMMLLFSVVGVAAAVWTANVVLARSGVTDVSDKARKYQIIELGQRVRDIFSVRSYLDVAFYKLKWYVSHAT
jgi:hypothetical protein